MRTVACLPQKAMTILSLQFCVGFFVLTLLPRAANRSQAD